MEAMTCDDDLAILYADIVGGAPVLSAVGIKDA
jgi:hypothetical protein